MNKQSYFNFELIKKNEIINFFVNKTNSEAYKLINNPLIRENIFLNGPKKSGKTHLVTIWTKLNDAIIIDSTINNLFSIKKNIVIDNVFKNLNEENLFHIINYCKYENLKILITSNIDLFEFNFKYPDLHSRLKTFYYVRIDNPDDEMTIMLLTKLLSEKQIIIKNKEIFEYLIKRINRTYKDVYNFSNKIDKISLEKKRQLTIPLIKEIL